jgi:hypothetical protein
MPVTLKLYSFRHCPDIHITNPEIVDRFLAGAIYLPFESNPLSFQWPISPTVK